MASKRTTPFDIPGLNKALTIHDLAESRNLYNNLPDDSQQPEILQSHIDNLAALFVRNRADGNLGIHLVHAHFAAPENTTVLGANSDSPSCRFRWAKPAAVDSIDLADVHGHIFVLTAHGFHPYEYQSGPAPDLSGVKPGFFPELAQYLHVNNLAELVGLQVIDESERRKSMIELVLPLATVMLDVVDVCGCAPTRQTGWKFVAGDGEARVCAANESHGRTKTGHDVFNKGAPLPMLETFKDVRNALVGVGILCQ